MSTGCRGEESQQRSLPRPARLKAGGKRKRAVRDVDANGQPATVIPTSHIRALMGDTRPLLKAQKRLTKASVRGSAIDALRVSRPSRAKSCSNKPPRGCIRPAL